MKAGSRLQVLRNLRRTAMGQIFALRREPPIRRPSRCVGPRVPIRSKKRTHRESTWCEILQREWRHNQRWRASSKVADLAPLGQLEIGLLGTSVARRVRQPRFVEALVALVEDRPRLALGRAALRPG